MGRSGDSPNSGYIRFSKSGKGCFNSGMLAWSRPAFAETLAGKAAASLCTYCHLFEGMRFSYSPSRSRCIYL